MCLGMLMSIVLVEVMNMFYVLYNCVMVIIWNKPPPGTRVIRR